MISCYANSDCPSGTLRRRGSGPEPLEAPFGPGRIDHLPVGEFGIDVDRAAGGVAWLTLRNPARLNAVRLEMWEAIPGALAPLAADPDVRVVVMRGHGEDAFASGADISEFQERRERRRPRPPPTRR